MSAFVTKCYSVDWYRTQLINSNRALSNSTDQCRIHGQSFDGSKFDVSKIECFEIRSSLVAWKD
jgi:hypothetical protein